MLGIEILAVDELHLRMRIADRHLRLWQTIGMRPEDNQASFRRAQRW